MNEKYIPLTLVGNGGGGPFFPFATRHDPEPDETLVAFVETLRTLAALPLYLELVVLILLFLPLKAVNPDELVVAVDTLAIEGA
jgi:hypothetical protein